MGQSHHKTPSVNPQNPNNVSLGQRVGRFIKSILGYLMIFVVVYTLMGYVRQPVMPLDVAPMTTLEGRAVAFSDTPTLVYFWGSWCHVCRHTSPAVNAIAQELPVVTVAVSSGDDGAVRGFLANKSYGFATVNDPSAVIFDKWQGQVTPSYVIVKNNQAVQSFVGIQPAWVLRMRLWIANWQ